MTLRNFFIIADNYGIEIPRKFILLLCVDFINRISSFNHLTSKAHLSLDLDHIYIGKYDGQLKLSLCEFDCPLMETFSDQTLTKLDTHYKQRDKSFLAPELRK
jgi:hypothetical protein